MEFPKSQTFIQDEQTMEADCKKQPKRGMYMQIFIKADRDEQTLMERNDRHNLI